MERHEDLILLNTFTIMTLEDARGLCLRRHVSPKPAIPIDEVREDAASLLDPFENIGVQLGVLIQAQQRTISDSGASHSENAPILQRAVTRNGKPNRAQRGLTAGKPIGGFWSHPRADSEKPRPGGGGGKLNGGLTRRRRRKSRLDWRRRRLATRRKKLFGNGHLLIANSRDNIRRRIVSLRGSRCQTMTKGEELADVRIVKAL